jgi:hypothetical protein
VTLPVPNLYARDSVTRILHSLAKVLAGQARGKCREGAVAGFEFLSDEIFKSRELFQANRGGESKRDAIESSLDERKPFSVSRR